MDYLDDDYDPLAPLAVGQPAGTLSEAIPDAPLVAITGLDADYAVPAPDISGAIDLEVTEDDEAEVTTGGVVDSRGVVRVWLAQGRLVGVRLSPVWHTKVAAEKLTNCFTDVLLKSIQCASEDQEEFEPDIAELDFDQLPELTPAVQQEFERHLGELEARFRAAAALAEATQAATEAEEIVWGRSQGAVVQVDAAGCTVAVEFDLPWLKQTHAGTVAKHILAAADRAYARIDAIQGEPSGMDELATEFRVMRLVYEAMARKAGVNG